MRRSASAFAVATAAGALLALAPAPADAAQRAGARYDGATPGDYRNFVLVARRNDRLKHYSFLARIPCSDGRERSFGIFRGGSDRGIPLDAQGAFAYHRRPQRFRAYRTRGLFRFRVDGAFDAAGESVSGTIAMSFASRRFDCAGQVAYTLHLDGTPNAPFATETVRTRRYRAEGPGVRVMLRPFVPGREIEWARLRWRAPCRDGGSMTGSVRDSNIYLRPDDTFSVRSRHRVRVQGGGVSRERTTFRGRFFRDPSGAYAVEGVWSIVARLTIGGRSTLCTARLPFRGAAL